MKIYGIKIKTKKYLKKDTAYLVLPIKEEKIQYMRQESKLEQALLDNILYIGEEIPELLAKDKRPKFVVEGTPQEIINETKSNIKYYLYGLNKYTFVFIFGVLVGSFLVWLVYYR